MLPIALRERDEFVHNHSGKDNSSILFSPRRKLFPFAGIARQRSFDSIHAQDSPMRELKQRNDSWN
jgi:hypothetical protein